MKIFYWKLLLIQTIWYILFYLMVHYDRQEIRFESFAIAVYGVSVTFSFLIPMTKIYLKSYARQN